MWFIVATFAIIVIALAGLFSVREVKNTIDIQAPVESVWRVLSDFPHYRDWNPFIVNVSGKMVQQSPLAVTIKPAIGGTMDFNLLLQSANPPLDMIWLGQTLLPKLLDGRHYFQVDSIDENSSRFTQGETYNGLFLFFAWPFLRWSVSRSFRDMNKALKTRAESDA